MSDTTRRDFPPEIEEARLNFIHDQAQYWLDIFKDEFDKLEDQTAVIINIVNGQYVTAPTRVEAWKKFNQKFGENNTFAHSFQVNYPIFVGGGVV